MMQEERDNPALEKSYAFALQIIGFVQRLQDRQEVVVLMEHLLRAGTAIGWNVEEGVGTMSGADFTSSMAVAFQEARATRYWLRLLRDSHSIDPEQLAPLMSDCEELLKILGAICKTFLKRRF